MDSYARNEVIKLSLRELRVNGYNSLVLINKHFSDIFVKIKLTSN